MKKHLSTIIISVFILVICFISAKQFLAQRIPEYIARGPGVTEIKMLSDWFPRLKGCRGDTEVYILRGTEPGGSVLIMGGSHPNEPAGYISAILLIENVQVSAGTLYIIPRLNNSAFSNTEPQHAHPRTFSIEKPDGSNRTFRFGSRLTNPLDQWPDLEVYIHAASGQTLSGNEVRNMNRAFPGRADGNFTERVAYGITELVKQENISMTIDLHEAAPEYPVVNAIVAHQRAMTIASYAIIFGLEALDITIGLEPSPPNLRGLSHRELGQYTNTLAILLETTNPAQGRLRGRTDETLVLTGRDKYYVRAHALGRLFVPYDDTGHSLDNRVARHMAAVQELIYALSDAYPELEVVVDGIPSYFELNEFGIGAFLK